MRSPFPRIPLSGKCDAGGTATITITAPSAFWAAVYVAVQVSAGSPSYTIQQGSALPMVFGGGTQTQLGPVLMQPGETFQLVINGAAALATVTGQVIGWQAEGPEELPAVIVSQGSVNIGSIASGVTIPVSGAVTIGAISGGVTMPISGNVGITGDVTATITAGTVTISNAQISVINASGTQLQTFQPQVLMGTVSSILATITGTFTLPSGTHAVALLYGGPGGFVAPINVLVLGVTSGATYLNLTAVTGVADHDSFIVASAVDSQITVRLGNPNPGVTTVKAFVVAILDTEAAAVQNYSDQPLFVKTSAVGGSDIMIRDSNSAAIALGQALRSASLPVTIASDQQDKGTWVSTLVSAVVGGFSIISANAARRGLIVNRDAGTASTVGLSFGGAGRVVSLPGGGYWECPRPVPTAALTGNGDTGASGNMTAIEIT